MKRLVSDDSEIARCPSPKRLRCFSLRSRGSCSVMGAEIATFPIPARMIHHVL